MNASALLDTNILLYAISSAADERPKRAIARELLARNYYGLSVQVLQQFYVNATRAPKPALTHRAAVEAVRELARVPVVALDLPLMERALQLKSRYPAFVLGCRDRRGRQGARCHGPLFGRPEPSPDLRRSSRRESLPELASPWDAFNGLHAAR